MTINGTDYQAEYVAFRADVLARVLPMPSVPPKIRYNHGENGFANYLLSNNATAKQLATYWLKWSKGRDAAFVQGMETKYPTLYKKGK